MAWRLGRKVRLNVYDDDRPVCQCHNVEDAERIADAVNADIEAALVKARVLDKYADRLVEYHNVDVVRIAELTRERDDLRAKLAELEPRESP